MVSIYDSLEKQTLASKNNYLYSIERVNATLESVSKNYRYIVNKLQEKDSEQIDYIKSKMERYGALIGMIGKEMGNWNEEIIGSAKSIDSKADLEILIESNKSSVQLTNDYQVVFQQFDESLYIENGNNSLAFDSENNPYYNTEQEGRTMEQSEPQVYDKEYDLINSLETFERDF